MESFKLTAPASLSDTADHRPYQEQGHFEGMMNHLYPLVIHVQLNLLAIHGYLKIKLRNINCMLDYNEKRDVALSSVANGKLKHRADREPWVGSKNYLPFHCILFPCWLN